MDMGYISKNSMILSLLKLLHIVYGVQDFTELEI